MNHRVRTVLAILIVALTGGAFIWYVRTHPEVLTQLKETSITVIASVLVLYIGMLACLIGVLHGSLMIYKKSLALSENILLTSYSSLVNFFGPGQSGPGFRGAYLKLKHNVAISQYIFVTLIYYAFYALFSGVLLFVGVRPWWQTALGTVAISITCALVLWLYSRRKRKDQAVISQTSLRPILIIGVMTFLQVMIFSVIYFIELRSLDSSVSFGQAMSYTGAANFALFASLTPGAIGIREAILVFTQQLHGIPNDLIVAANIIDRAVYLLFLGIVFVFIVSVHAKSRLGIAPPKSPKP